MEKGTKIFLGVLGTSLTIYGIYMYSQFMKLYNAPFKVIGAQNVVYNNDKLSLKLLTQISNFGDISGTVKDQKYEIYLNDKLISNINNKDEVKIVSNGKSILPFNIDVDLKKLDSKLALSILTYVITDKSKIKLTIKGELTIKAGIITKVQPFELNFTLKEIIDMSKASK